MEYLSAHAMWGIMCIDGILEHPGSVGYNVYRLNSWVHMLCGVYGV